MAVQWQSWYLTWADVTTRPVLFAGGQSEAKKRRLSAISPWNVPQEELVWEADHVGAHWIPTTFQPLGSMAHTRGREVG